MLALVLLASPCLADRIELSNGNRLEGTLTRLPGGRVEIRLSYGRLVLPAAQIRRIERRPTRADRLQARLASLTARDADGRYRLALQARSERLYSLERRLLEQVVALRPDHTEARRALGYRLHAGRWLLPDAWRAARGEVFFRGRWVPAQQREATLSEELAARQAAELAALEAAQRARMAMEVARLQQEVERLRQPRYVVIDHRVHVRRHRSVRPVVERTAPRPCRTTRIQTPRPIPPGGLPLGHTLPPLPVFK